MQLTLCYLFTYLPKITHFHPSSWSTFPNIAKPSKQGKGSYKPRSVYIPCSSWKIVHIIEEQRAGHQHFNSTVIYDAASQPESRGKAKLRATNDLICPRRAWGFCCCAFFSCSRAFIIIFIPRLVFGLVYTMHEQLPRKKQVSLRFIDF